MKIEVHIHQTPDDEVLRLLRRLLLQGNMIMATQAEAALQIDSLKDQVTKIRTEVVSAADGLRTQIASLEEALANVGTEVAPALQASIAGLQAVLQDLDDLNPDA